MSNLYNWFVRWQLPPQAIAEYRQLVGIKTDPQAVPHPPASEAAIQQQIRMEASRKGGRLWRNNNGATVDERGNFIRFGLCNDSKQLNEKIKSSDLIGITPVEVTEIMIGQTVGIFTAREVKSGNWKYRGTAREVAQLAFIELVNSLGGDARFVNGGGE